MQRNISISGTFTTLGTPFGSRALAATAGMCVIAGSALATGPSNQRIGHIGGAPSWSALDSVVQVRTYVSATGYSYGTGAVVGQKIGSDGNLWLGVLTADHVGRSGGMNSVVGNGHAIAFGDNAGQGLFGRTWNGGTSSFYRAFDPKVDMGFVAINLGPNDGTTNAAGVALYGKVTPLSYTAFPTKPDGSVNVNNQNFTQMGYGQTGGAQTVLGAFVGVNNTGSDGNRRFQNNIIDGTKAIVPNWTTGADAYDYTAIQFDLDAPAAAGFLKYEGISFRGDSGSPYLSGNLGDVTFGGDTWSVMRNTIFGVHTFGDPNTAVGGMAAVGTTGGGVALTAAHVAWITGNLAVLPSPGTGALLGMAGLLATRRRRV